MKRILSLILTAVMLTTLLPAAAFAAEELSPEESGAVRVTLGEGAGELSDGVDKLDEGAGKLEDGAKTAASGSDELVDGLKEYNDQGISKIVQTVENDLGGFVDRLKKTIDLGKSYNNFAGKAEGTPSSVRFVFEVAGITAED